MRKFLTLAAAMLALSTVSVMADAFSDGATAYKRGDYGRAINSWRSLANNNPTVQNNYGVMYMNGRGVPRNYTTALQWFSRSAASGSSLGQNNLGGMYRDGRGVTRDFGKAITFFQAAAAQGNPGAQANLGLMFLNGQGTRVDPLKAYMWFDLAASQNVPQAIANRNNLRQRMTAAAINQGTQMSQRCRSMNFKNCG